MRALDKPLDKYKYLQNLSLANEHLCAPRPLVSRASAICSQIFVALK